MSVKVYSTGNIVVLLLYKNRRYFREVLNKMYFFITVHGELLSCGYEIIILTRYIKYAS